MERSRQEDTDAKRDMVLASKDARIKGSLMLAAGQQQKNLKEEEVKARKSISDIQHLRNDAGMLAEALLGARRDMREAGQEMHGHFSETERILGGIKALDAEHQKLAADDFRLAKGVEQARKEVMPQLQQVQRANGIIAGAEAARCELVQCCARIFVSACVR